MHRRALSPAIADVGRRYLELLALLTMLVASAVIGRGDMLDDAFIHLRYADAVLSRGAFEYNPGEPSYGTSSPLFVLLLAALRWLPVDYHLPKLLSGAAWVLLLALIWRLSASRQNPTRSALVLFAAAVASPFGCRWLASGMETSLVAVWSLATAFLCARLLCGRESRGTTLAAAVIAATGVLLRIELTVLVAVLIVLCAIRAGRTGASLAPVAAGLCGLGAGFALLWVMFGQITPDAAIAKSGTASLSAAFLGFADTVEVAIDAHMAASFFGLVLMLLVAASFVRAMMRLRGLQRLIVAGANLLYPLLILAIAARHQWIHGVRYFVFLDVFLIVFNLHAVAYQAAETEVSTGLRSTRWLLMRSAAVLAALAWTIFDLRLYAPLASGRAEAYRTLSSMDLGAFNGQLCIGADVGAIGYFSKCQLFDLSGLVNGRAMAELDSHDRYAAISKLDPVLAFVNENHLKGLSAAGLDLSSWAVMGRFDLPNVSGSDLHLLLAKPGRISASNAAD